MKKAMSENIHDRELDLQRLAALTHYICCKSHDPSLLGATKLNKILWYSDLLCYMKFGQSITGESYVKQQYGPVPKHILGVTDELEKWGAIVSRNVPFFGRTKREYIALKEPDISEFNANEISIVDEVFDLVCHKHTAQSISEASHGDIWKLAEIGEEIPFYAAFASKLGEITGDDVEWAREAGDKVVS